MVLRLQSVLVLSLSGVLAFLGLWWYTSRKRGQPTDKDKTTTDQAHLSSSTRDRGIGVVENGHSTGTDRDRQAVRKRSLVEQELVDCANTQAAAKLGNVPLSQSQLEERVVAAECLSRGLDTATVKPVTERTESSAQVLPETAPKSQAQEGPEKDLALQRKHQPSSDEEQVSSIFDLGSNPNPGESAGLKPHAPPLSETLEDTTNRIFNKEAAEEVRLDPGEVRLDPEGEVGEDKITFCFAEMKPQTNLAENCLLSKDNLSILPAVEEPTSESSLQDDSCLASPINFLTSQVSPSRQPLGILRSPQKKDQSEECELSRSNTAEINQLASSLITDVVSVAVSQVLKEKTLLDHNVGPLRNRDPFTSLNIISMGNSETGREMPGLLQEDQCSTTGRENICSSPIVYEDVKHDCSSRDETEQAELAEEDSAVSDSGSSSGHSEESSSGEDSSPSVSPQPPRGPAEGLWATSMGLPNGHMTEEVAVPGSGVNIMDSVDRYVEHEARDNQHINSPSPISQLLITDQQIEKYVQSYNSSQPPTVWDIEVPKHLVGRLIGKQGRYVSYLKETSGANIFIATLPYTQEFQICHIEGLKEQVDCALDLIRKKFKDLDVTSCYVHPPVASLPALPITSWLLLPHRVTVEVTVIQVASGNYVFLQQHTHPTFHALRSLDQQMSLCYSHPGCPSLPAPVEVGVICAAQMPEGAWWRAQVMGYYEETKEVELCYVDYGGYVMVKIDTLRQIRSDFVALPFQGSEAILEHIAPLPGEGFSAAAKSALEEMTQGLPLLAQVTNCHTSGIPLVQIWRTEGEELVSVNRALVDNGLCSWVDCL
ncbi:A-kinase anchor protein 1, mitochondrial-like [Salvelinus fontinalis]|uniref:A-kinase anchor protein 1, mitochondrial-like n=1 Tax=Salvelinus fontinalis TaxID=8038 RepID=UPI00248571C0|nr:A-kinase anchor protein 1, mitochondrial-like [Salvelinus fontinalis]XP_055798777.1 A-kinase anchor protein 1, mitochondrial-like [Salvelinus fontinalis]